MSDIVAQILDDVACNGPWVIERDGKPAVVIIECGELEALRDRITELNAAWVEETR